MVNPDLPRVRFGTTASVCCKIEIASDECGECKDCAEQRLKQGGNQSGYDELSDLSDSDDASAGYAEGKAVRIVVVDEISWLVRFSFIYL